MIYNAFQLTRHSSKLPLHAWDDLHLVHGSLGPPESTPKRHLDRFSHFCMAHSRDRQLDRRYSVLASAAMPNKSSAVAEMGDRGHNRHGPKREGGCCACFAGAGTPSSTMWSGPRSTSTPSGVFIHSAIWPQ